MSQPRSSPDRTEDSVETVYQALRSEILVGALDPGAVLSQVQLAARFNISRTPLREALRRLVAEGLVVGDFNRRMRVSELNLEDFDQIYAMRIALEPIAIAATLGKLTATTRAQLSHHVVAMDEAIEQRDPRRFSAEHRAFHLGLTLGSGPRLVRLIEDLWDHTERYRQTYLHNDYDDPNSASYGRLAATQADHRAILDAALAGDVAACATAHLHHLRRALDIVYTEAAAPPRARVTAEALRLSNVDRLP